MQPVINLEETPGKVVGRRHMPVDGLRLSDAQRADNARAWRKGVGGLRVPRGVYRFRTHEEADAWLWQKLTQNRR